MSQIWLFFVPGAGGDGVANLLERCRNVKSIDNYPFDGPTNGWRIQRIVDGGIKFYAPTVDTNACFRKNSRNSFRVENNTLNPIYESAVINHQSIIVTSHDIDLEGLVSSDKKDLFCQGQITVLLECRDHNRCYINQKKKNLQEFPSQHLWIKDTIRIDGKPVYPNIDHTKFDHVIYIEDLQQDFAYLEIFLQQVGLDIDKKYYDQYIKLINGNLSSIRTDAPCYTSYIDDCMVKYYQSDSIYS